ncbi:hypothetical protein IAT38_001634 [Cryptococcus sp. DSM 104549]
MAPKKRTHQISPAALAAAAAATTPPSGQPGEKERQKREMRFCPHCDRFYGSLGPMPRVCEGCGVSFILLWDRKVANDPPHVMPVIRVVWL